ncbi:MAG: hypothetical protein ACFHWX_02585 [Bacteroidota bacterium]
MEDESSDKPAGEETIELSRNSMMNLKEVMKWTKFLAIVGFIFIGLIVILAFGIRSIMPNMGPAAPVSQNLFTFIYLVMGAIYFFPILYLFNFSKHLKRSLINRDSHALDAAFENLNAHYRFIGILAIIGLVIYGIAGIFIVFAMGMGAFPGGSVA